MSSLKVLLFYEYSLLIGTTLSVRDKMVAARNRLRVLMGQKPIGITTGTPRFRISTPTTPRPSTPTKMENTRQKIIDNLRLEQEAQEALNSTDLDLSKANIELPPDPQITVTAKSTISDVNNEPLDINPLVLISPTFPPETNTQTPETSTSTKPSTTSKPMEKDVDVTTIKSNIEDVVLDVPTRMQDTLMRLMQKTGLRRDPFAR